MEFNKQVQQVQNGEADAIIVFAAIKTEIDRLTKLLDQVKQNAFNDANQFEDKTFEFKGYKVTKVAGRAIWNFKGIPDIVEKENELKLLKDKYKAIHKSYLMGNETINEDGELLPVPAVTYSKDTISIKKIND